MNCWRESRGLRACEGETVILDLPDIRQEAEHDCGAAAVAVVMQFHGLQSGRWVKRLANPVQGMSPDTIEAVLWEAFGNVSRGTMTVDDLRHFANSQRPVLCPVTIDGSGHWVVSRGVAYRRVHYHDPISGPASMSIEAWGAAWQDFTVSGPYRRFGLVGWPA